MVRPAEASPERFGAVLTLLCVGYLVYALTAAPWAHWLVSLLYLAALFFAVRTADPGPRLRRLVRVLLAASALVSAGALTFLPHATAIGVLDAVLALLLATTLAIILGRVLSGRDVTLNTIAGALSAYLILGLFFANVFGVLAWLLPGPFFADGQEVSQQSLQYFSFTTLTTVGYGDFTAASYPGRGVATFEALVAQVFLATLVARLVASFRRPGRPAPPGPDVAAAPTSTPGPPTSPA